MIKMQWFASNFNGKSADKALFVYEEIYFICVT